jgi:hypothetical protein
MLYTTHHFDFLSVMGMLLRKCCCISLLVCPFAQGKGKGKHKVKSKVVPVHALQEYTGK